MADSHSVDGVPRGSEPIEARVFINERGVSVAHGATALDAVSVFDAAQAEAVRAGALRVTDSRGLPVPTDTVVHGGAIYRLVPVRDAETTTAAAAPSESMS